MTEKEMKEKYCPLAQGSCKGSTCVAWKPGTGRGCLIMTYYDLFAPATPVTTPTREA